VKIGILVVAFNAQETLKSTLERIPNQVLEQGAFILVSDDESSDSTHKIAQDLESSLKWPMAVVRQEKNLGYGGNQKFGYSWFLERGYDAVVLLHADGQYAPEYMPKLINELKVADAVFGSRMLIKGGALRGGMPKYKYVGNKILTTLQNQIVGVRLSEWHSGYRAYTSALLSKIPLSELDNGYRFDTQIILATIRNEGRIKEVEIPTYYGDEISYVNGMKYAREIIVDTIRFRLGKNGRK
jgi:glycosyltransferase involved in cell wall biosynthesis